MQGGNARARGDAPAPDEAVEHVRRLARLLDDSIPIPGTSWRIGLDPLLGLVPGLGDVASAVLAAYPLLVAARLGAPPAVLARILGNVALDAAAGSIPVLGDLLDAGYKANVRNARLLEEWLARPRETRRTSRLAVAAALAAAALIVGSVAWAAWSVAAWAVRTAASQ